MIRHGLIAVAALVVAVSGAGPALATPDGGPDGTTGAGPSVDVPADGYLPDGQRLSPFDLSAPAVNRLDPDLRDAVQQASRAAAAEGVTIGLTSGWRSPEFQRQLFDDAVAQYGSAEIASQYVASPDVSKHVIGRAVDIGPTAADDWLIRNGERFGLCQIYANEVWHFELASDYGNTCPPLRPNAAG